MIRSAHWLKHGQARVRVLKTEVRALLLARQDPRVPWRAKILTALVVAYALSPIDLIPDFIPILGHLDDLILLPLGILLVLKMIPPDVMHDCRMKAAAPEARDKPCKPSSH